MNIFRSEEHVHAWNGFKAGTEEGIIPLLDMVEVFSVKLFTRRLDSDYVSNMLDYMREFVGTFQDKGQFWQPPST